MPNPHVAFMIGAVLYAAVALRVRRDLILLGARPLVVAVTTAAPILALGVLEASYALGLGPFPAVLVATALTIAAACPDCAVRATGGPRPIVALGNSVIRVYRLVGSHEQTTELSDRRVLERQIEQELHGLDRYRAADTSEYIDGFTTTIRHYISGQAMHDDVDLLQRLRETERSYHDQIRRWGVRGAIERWGSNDS